MADMEIPDHLSALKAAQNLNEKVRSLRHATEHLEHIAMKMDDLNSTDRLKVQHLNKKKQAWVEHEVNAQETGFHAVKDAMMEGLKAQLSAAYERVEKLSADIKK